MATTTTTDHRSRSRNRNSRDRPLITMQMQTQGLLNPALPSQSPPTPTPESAVTPTPTEEDALSEVASITNYPMLTCHNCGRSDAGLALVRWGRKQKLKHLCTMCMVLSRISDAIRKLAFVRAGSLGYQAIVTALVSVRRCIKLVELVDRDDGINGPGSPDTPSSDSD